MKTSVFLVIVMLTVVSCLKTMDIPESEFQYVPINFSSVSPFSDGHRGDTLTTQISVIANDQCFKLTGYNIQPSPSSEYTYDIQAVASYPTKPVGCSDVIYVKDSTISFKPKFEGQYVFRYYNGMDLFKTDTVNVQ